MQIAASMKEWGWTNPVLIDEEGGIIAGHGRVLAARKLGLAEAPVMIAAGWSKAQRAAYVLADNQLALNAGWHMEALSVELKGLNEAGFDLSLLGFGDLDALLADKTAGLTDPPSCWRRFARFARRAASAEPCRPATFQAFAPVFS